MSNSYFQFKKFRIDQGDCAMKVSTEACIFGAWVPVEDMHASVLDIGAGTGLLSLMLAQRMTKNEIDAIEINVDAAEQCQKNFDNSPWKNRLALHEGSVFDFAGYNAGKYDLVICNPPFYTASLKSDASSKNLAKHDTSCFNKKDFAKCIDQLLSVNNGTAYVLYPKLEADEFTILVKGLGLFVKEILVVRNQPSKAVFRVVLMVSRKVITKMTEELCIRDGQNHTAQFEALLQDYYLKL